MTDQKPKRRKCSFDCPYWLPPLSVMSGCECRLRLVSDPFIRTGDDCRAYATELRRRAADDPAGWEADELRARGLRV